VTQKWLGPLNYIEIITVEPENGILDMKESNIVALKYQMLLAFDFTLSL
jgi:hypothetical protein